MKKTIHLNKLFQNKLNICHNSPTKELDDEKISSQDNANCGNFAPLDSQNATDESSSDTSSTINDSQSDNIATESDNKYDFQEDTNYADSYRCKQYQKYINRHKDLIDSIRKNQK